MVAMAGKRSRTMTSRFLRWRVPVQAGFLAVWLIPLRLFNVCGPVYHCYACPLAFLGCPIGIAANFAALHVVPFIALGTLLVVGGLFGAFICGWACPFGFLQDIIGRIPTRKFKLPAWTGHFRYVVLVVGVLAVPYLFGEGHPLFICRVCPAGAITASLPSALEQAFAGEVVTWPNAIKIGVVIFVAVALLATHRPWCTLFCPLGAVLGLLNRVSAFFLRFNAERCNSCELCHRQCPIGIKPDENANDTRCTRCLECTTCGAITVGTVFKKSPEAPGLHPDPNPSGSKG